VALCLQAAVLILLSPAAARAQTNGSWIVSSGNNGNWSDSTTWTGGAIADGATATATFPSLGSINSLTVTLDTDRTIGTLAFTPNARTPGWALSGTKKLTLNNGASIPLVRSINSGGCTISVVLDGTNGLRTPDQVGTVTMNGTNTYTGDTELYRGTLKIGFAGALPSGSRTGNVNFINNGSGNGTLDLNNKSITINGLASISPGLGTVTSGAAGAITLTLGDNNASATFSGVIQNGSGTVGLTKIGLGTQTLSGVNTYSGATTISTGVVAVATGGSCANSDVSVGASGALKVQYTGADATWAAKSLTYSASSAIQTFDLGTNQPSATAAPLTLSQGVTFAGTPTVTITGPVITNGTYPLIKYTTSITAPGNMPLTANLPGGGTGTLQDNSGTQTIELVVGGGVFPPVIHWATGNGTWDTSLLNWKGFSGNTTNYVQGVPVQFKDTDATGNPTVTLNISVQPASVAVNASSHDYTLTGSGAITGAAELSKSGSSALTLDLANTHTGGTTLSQGTLNLKNAAAMGDVTGPLSLLGGTLDNTSAGALTTPDYPQAWGGDFAFTGTHDLNLGAGAVTLSGSRMVTVNAGTLTIGGNIAGSGLGLTKAGNGTLALDAGLNTSSGGTLTVNAGTLRLGLGNTSFLYNGNTRIVGGTLLLTHTNAMMNSRLDMNGADAGALSFGSLTTATLGSLIGSRGIGLTNASGAAAELRVGNKGGGGNGDAYTGTLSASGGLTKIGDGNWQLGSGGVGVNTYSGDTMILNGTLKIGANNVLPHGTGKGNLFIDTAGVFDLVDRTQITVNGLNGTGTVDCPDRGGASGPQTLSVGDGNAAGNFSGVIQNVAAPNKTAGLVTLVKAGTGTQILSGVNTYSGTTTVNGGTLLVNSPGSLPATACTVNSGGTLGGDGYVNGPVTIAAGGSIGAGASPGTLTLADGLDLSSGGTNIWELAANSESNPGADFDQIVLSGGTLTLGGSSVLSIRFINAATAPDASMAFWQSSRSWTIISASGASSTFATIQNGSFAAGTFTTSAQAGGIVLTFTPAAAGGVPRPVITSITGAGTTSVMVNYSNTLAGTNYTLQYKTNLSSANWSNVSAAAAGGSTASQTDHPPAGDRTRFYRVVAP
jgi:autotransporter-associated beta strand protein